MALRRPLGNRLEAIGELVQLAVETPGGVAEDGAGQPVRAEDHHAGPGEPDDSWQVQQVRDHPPDVRPEAAADPADDAAEEPAGELRPIRADPDERPALSRSDAHLDRASAGKARDGEAPAERRDAAREEPAGAHTRAGQHFPDLLGEVLVVLGADLRVHHPLDGVAERRASDRGGDARRAALVQLARRALTGAAARAPPAPPAPPRRGPRSAGASSHYRQSKATRPYTSPLPL